MTSPIDETFAGRRVLILGGSGFIGANLAIRLVEAGAIVTSFGRSNRHRIEKARWVRGDFEDRGLVAEVAYGQEFIFHCVSQSVPGTSNLDIAGDLVGNVVSTLSLLEVCRDLGPVRVVFCSSGGTVYGPQGRTKLSEDHPTNPISAYGISKLAIEKYLALHHHLYGLDYVVLRIANPFGPLQSARRRQGLVAALLERALSGAEIEVWGDGVVRDYIFIDDLIDAMLAAATIPAPHRLFNIGSGVGRSTEEVIDAVEAALGLPVKRRIVPSRPADVPYNVLDTSRIAAEIGWAPSREWFRSIALTADWYRRHGEGAAGDR